MSDLRLDPNIKLDVDPVHLLDDQDWGDWKQKVSGIRDKQAQALRQKTTTINKKKTPCSNSQHGNASNSNNNKKKKTKRTKKSKMSSRHDGRAHGFRLAVKEIQPDDPLFKIVLQHMTKMSVEMEQQQQNKELCRPMFGDETNRPALAGRLLGWAMQSSLSPLAVPRR